MKKHFITEITDHGFTWQRDAASIAAEAALDGFYIVHTNVPGDRLDATETVGAYKSLASVEQAFRTLKIIDLNVRPIHHRKAAHPPAPVHAHLLRRASHAQMPPLHALRRREPSGKDPNRRAGGAVGTGTGDGADQPDAMPVHSFRTLLADLGIICRQEVTPRQDGEAVFEMVTRPTPLQNKALEMLNPGSA